MAEPAVIPLAPKPKARPRVTANGTYMPSDYQEWRRAVALLLRHRLRDTFEGPVEVRLVFRKDDFTVEVVETDNRRHGRSDLDNLTAGAIEALQDSGVIADDRQVSVLYARFG